MTRTGYYLIVTNTDGLEIERDDEIVYPFNTHHLLQDEMNWYTKMGYAVKTKSIQVVELG